MSGDTITPIDITQVILDTANTLCSNILDSISSTIYSLIDDTLFLNAEITEDSLFAKVFGNSPTSGVLLLANCLLFAFILYYCIRLITSRFSGNEIESPGRFFFRAILAAILMNSSLGICQILLTGTDQISHFFLELGQTIFHKETISFSSLINDLGPTSSGKFTIFSIDGILTSMLSISSFALLLSFAVRYVVVQLLILSAPFAFLCIANQSTEGFLRSWYRSFLSLLLLQIVIAALLLIPYTLLGGKSNTMLDKILLVGSISALLKSSQFIKEFLSGIGISTNFQAGISGLKSMFSK